MNCEFCNYSMNIEPQRIVYEDEDYMAFISREPLVNGHCIIMPKEHVEFIADIEDLKRFFTLVRYLSQSIKDTVNANHIKIEMRYGNDNHKIKHAHTHLIPVFLDVEGAKLAEKIIDVDQKIL